MRRVTFAMMLVGLLITLSARAGEWHTGTTNICTDCHSMHFSQQHDWDSNAVPSTSAASNGNWLPAEGPNPNLLKIADVNALCDACHEGQAMAPDVMGFDSDPLPSQGREAGALNDPSLGAPYEVFKGHTLGSTATPPGYNPVLVGAPPAWYDASKGLRCASCHGAHGSPDSYRNLGPEALGPNVASFRPTYIISTANDTTKDVWIDISPGYTANSGNPATFDHFYDAANVNFNRIDRTVGGRATSNAMDTFCAACHGDFHGGPGDANIGGSLAGMSGFLRHPTSQAAIGLAAAQGLSGHSPLSRFAGGTTRLKVYADDRVGFTDATPGCITCHKAHGNRNPFGLIFMPRNGVVSSTFAEEGFWDPSLPYQRGYVNLCGQCHDQAN
jgi:hypothetical protein